jgi:hypothetical protein
LFNVLSFDEKCLFIDDIAIKGASSPSESQIYFRPFFQLMHMRTRGRSLEQERKALRKEAGKLERQLDTLERQIAGQTPPHDEFEANIDGLYYELLRIKRLHVIRIKDFANETGVAGIDAYTKDCEWYSRKTEALVDQIEILQKKHRHA